MFFTHSLTNLNFQQGTGWYLPKDLLKDENETKEYSNETPRQYSNSSVKILKETKVSAAVHFYFPQSKFQPSCEQKFEEKEFALQQFSKTRPQVTSKIIESSQSLLQSKDTSQASLEDLTKELKDTIVLAKKFWIQGEPEHSRELLKQFREKANSVAFYWRPYEFLEWYLLFHEAENKLEEAAAFLNLYMRYFETSGHFRADHLHHLEIKFLLQLKQPTRKNLLSEFPVKSNLTQFFQNNYYKQIAFDPVIKIKFLITLAKFAYLLNDKNKDQYFNLLETCIVENLEVKEFNFALNELEKLSIDLGDAQFLYKISKEFLLRNEDFLRKKTKGFQKGTQTLTSYSLVYDEALQLKSYSLLKQEYQSLLNDDPLNCLKIEQYLYFLIRGGEIDEALGTLQYLFDNESFKNLKELRAFELILIKLLINNGLEDQAMEKLNKYTQEGSKQSPFLFEKAFLHLNPLSIYFNVKKAEEILEIVTALNIAEQFPETSLIAYRIAFFNQQSKESAKRSLLLKIKSNYGLIQALIKQLPSHSIIPEKGQLLFDILDKVHTEKLFYLGEMRKNCTLDETFAYAQNEYKENSRLKIYRQLISPIGMNLGNLHEEMNKFNSSQRLSAIFDL